MNSSPTRQPVLFIGHGSPMNAIAPNAFTARLQDLGRELNQERKKPRAIVSISAHWMTHGTHVTHTRQPQTIHDFHGFPQALFDVEYAAPGDPALAEAIASRLPTVSLDEKWGLDHGTWAILRFLFPQADVPVLQLSLDQQKDPEAHLRFARELAWLRDENVLLIGSGNITHNLRRIERDPQAAPVAWAVEFDAWVRSRLLAHDGQALATDFHQTEAGRLSIPSIEHYLPLLYVIGASEGSETLKFEYEGFEHGSLAMTSFSFGR